MKTNLKAIRHGEVMLVPVGKIPTGKTATYDAYVIGHSETGHHHVLECTGLELTETESKELFIKLFKPGKLIHQKTVDKHKDLIVPAGMYQRFQDTEYDPFSGIIRAVKD